MSSSSPPPRFARPDPLVGSVINGKYRVGTLVASGGMGRIYRAEQLPLGRTVALKVLHAHSTAHLDDPGFKKRFFREASILAKLQHPNIVTLFDYGAIEGPHASASADDERYFMVMEYLQGETLLRRIHDRGTLSARHTIHIARQIARGLCEAHAAGIVHRDLKPANVMLLASRGESAEADEHVKILDFGIVKVVGDEDPLEDLTQEGSFIGSPKYMAPEQIRRGEKVDPRTDVYSLGIILYQCLCGEVPFDAESSIETMMLHLNQSAVPIHERAPGADAPVWLEELVMACIEKDPSKRPQSMDEVARVLSSGDTPPSAASISVRIAASGGASGNANASANEASGTRRTRISESPTITEAIASLPPHPRESTAAPRARASPAMIAAAFVAALLVFVAVRVTERPPVMQVQSAPAAAPITPAASLPATKRAFRLEIESTPTGADVREGDSRLGTTPLTLSVDNEDARKDPRKLTLAKDGYQPYSIVQGPSEDNVRVLATLVTALPAPTSPAALAPAPPKPAKATSTKGKDGKDGKDGRDGLGQKLDIRLTR